MNLIDKVMEAYGKDSDWASRFITMCQVISQNQDVFTHLCNLSRESWAIHACNTPDCNSPRYAYFRGKSDCYNDLPMSFISNFKEMSQC